MIDLNGRVVLVTGGNGGIGLGIAKGCVKAGADVVIWGTNQDKLAAAEAELNDASLQASRMRVNGAGRVLAQRVDVREEAAVVGAFAEAVAALDHVDAVFANAGVGESAPFIEQTLELWRRVHAVNIDGAFLTLREGARHMVARGEGGSLVGISSTSAIHGAPRSQPYAVSKAGILALMRGLSVELARYGIRANSIIPGWTETEMTEAGRENEKFLTNTTQRTPIRRWGTPDDFEAIGAFLADPSQPFHTGDELVVDGGYTRF